MLALCAQYILQPIPLILTVVPPIVIFLISRRYVWFSIPLTALVELVINWGNFCYYESRGLMIAFTLMQLAVMAALILLLKAAVPKRKQ